MTCDHLSTSSVSASRRAISLTAGGKLERVGAKRRVGREARQQRQVLLALGDRPDARQHHGAAAAGLEERLLQRARGAPRRQAAA